MFRSEKVNFSMQTEQARHGPRQWGAAGDLEIHPGPFLGLSRQKERVFSSLTDNNRDNDEAVYKDLTS